MTAREDRLAATLAARAARRADPAVQAAAEAARAAREAAPRCVVRRCAEPQRPAPNGGRCARHFGPMREIVGVMAGEAPGHQPTRRAFSQMMSEAGITLDRWAALDGATPERAAALLDGFAATLLEAGYYVGAGARGGWYLERLRVVSP